MLNKTLPTPEGLWAKMSKHFAKKIFFLLSQLEIIILAWFSSIVVAHFWLCQIGLFINKALDLLPNDWNVRRNGKFCNNGLCCKSQKIVYDIKGWKKVRRWEKKFFLGMGCKGIDVWNTFTHFHRPTWNISWHSLGLCARQCWVSDSLEYNFTNFQFIFSWFAQRKIYFKKWQSYRVVYLLKFWSIKFWRKDIVSYFKWVNFTNLQLIYTFSNAKNIS